MWPRSAPFASMSCNHRSTFDRIVSSSRSVERMTMTSYGLKGQYLLWTALAGSLGSRTRLCRRAGKFLGGAWERYQCFLFTSYRHRPYTGGATLTSPSAISAGLEPAPGSEGESKTAPIWSVMWYVSSLDG